MLPSVANPVEALNDDDIGGLEFTGETTAVDPGEALPEEMTPGVGGVDCAKHH